MKPLILDHVGIPELMTHINSFGSGLRIPLNFLTKNVSLIVGVKGSGPSVKQVQHRKLLEPFAADSNKRSLTVLFGEAVAPQQKSTIMRGKAGGVATVTEFPIQPYQYPAPDFLFKSTRYMDCVVHVNQHVSIYVATLYGVAGQNSAHPTSLTYDIFNQATERGLSYKGPAVICGDFNVPLDSLEAWNTLRRHGWFDAALVDSIKFQRDLQPTSKHGSRHSFILMNQQMASSFYACRTSENYDFDSHPLLVAGFNVETFDRPLKNWILPKSFDSFLFDEGELRIHTKRVTEQRSHLFDAAIEHSNLDEAARQFTIAVEEVFKQSAVCVEGNKVCIPPGHFGRSKDNPFGNRSIHVPCVKAARNGEFNPIVTQMTNGLRLHTKQLRRLKAILDQTKALDNNASTLAHDQCQELWNKVLDAHGFAGSFGLWICQHCTDFVPLVRPSVQYLQQLLECFQKFHKENLNHYYLAQRKRNRVALDIDIEKGGSTCFKDVKDDLVPPIDAIHWSVSHTVKKTAWKKEGKKDLELLEKPQFNVNMPVTFQGQTRSLTSIRGNVIHLDSPVKLKDGKDMKITQENASSEPECMHKQLATYWSTLWQRDHVSVDQQDWKDADAFITCLNDCPTCKYEPIVASKWFASLKGVSRKSARGADGFSTKDFDKINHELLQWLFRIFAEIENNVAWPRQWSISKVTVLAKGSKPKTPLDIRPITILPKVYRLWSRIRSLEVLNHLSKLMPPQIAATAGGVSADQVAAFTALAIEKANFHQSQLCGLIIDLIKCYNTVPWEPSRNLLKHLGIPVAYLTPFFNFLQNLGRVFQIHEHCGDIVTCTTGIPEGCAMSVAIMAALSWWCYAVIQNRHPIVTTLCYADNWGLMASESQHLFDSTQTLFAFIDSLKMQISIKKSWFWGSSTKLRKELRNPPPALKDIEVVNYAVDLGCDQNYTKKIHHGKQKDRMKKARRVLKRISKKTLPKRFRPTITQSAGFSVVAYGIEISRVTEATWSKLRTAIASALGRNAAGSNPFLACICGNSPSDPQLRAVIRTLLFWRRYFKRFVDARDEVCHMILQPIKHGPVSYLARRLTEIGWSPQPHGFIAREDGTSFSWITCSSTFLRKTLRKYWDEHISQKIQHRKDFDMETIDEFNIVHNLEKFPEHEKSMLQTYLAGAAFTRDVTSKYSHDGDHKCPHCGCDDSKEHRLLRCSKFDHLRPKYAEVINWVQDMPRATINLAIIPRHIGATKALVENQKIWPTNHLPTFSSEGVHVFTDGSSFWQDQPSCTLSGAAAVVTDKHGEICEVVATSPMPGIDHNSYRAEIFAVLLVLQNIYLPIIYCDCLGVVDKLNSLVESHQQQLPPKFCDHWDIWIQVWEQIVRRPPGSIQIIKVRAHVDHTKLICPIEKWKAISNDRVDKLAKQVVIDWEPVFSNAKQAYDEIIKQKQMHLELCKIIVDIGNISVVKPSEPEVIQTEAPVSFDNLTPDCRECLHFPVVCPEVKCPFGDIFLQRVVTWAKKLQWPHVAQGEISMLELYIDFVLDTKTLTPVPVKYAKDGRVTSYGLRDIDPNAKIIVHTLAQQNIIWNRFLKWVSGSGVCLWPIHDTISSNCLGHVGYSLRSPAILNRPILSCGNQSCHVLYKLFHTGGGKIRTLNIAFNGP